MRLDTRAALAGFVALVLLGTACGQTSDGPVTPGAMSSTGAGLTLQGAGASFPGPLYSKWTSEYNRANPGVRIDYQSIGSGGGIKQISERTVDFGATDAPMTDEQLETASKEILHIPTVLGAVVVTYNLAGLEEPLNLDGETTAEIFLGKITKWNDPKLAALNPGGALPSSDIAVTNRADGSGTTAIFVDFLSKVSPEWKEKVGTGTTVKWPVGPGNKGNDGVAGYVKNTPGAVSYVELIYAKNNGLATAKMKNSAGKFVEPTLDSVTAAADGVATSIPDDLRVSITNAAGEASYPISGFTYLLVYKDQDDAVKGKALVDFIAWALKDGEAMARELVFAPLPAAIRAKAEAKLKLVNHAGKALLA
ncbi:MAG: phosphate ABC transporter substrate-binding protein PstS [Acidobacteria bacterium]|nr:phosphate ABC transporter substrate-binding protein PstS [Acidobacteriota bacterium]